MPGQDSSIDAQANVRNSILWDEVTHRTRRQCQADRSSGTACDIRTGESVEDAVIVRAEVVAGQKSSGQGLKGRSESATTLSSAYRSDKIR